MVFRFTEASPIGQVIDMALEATFNDGKTVQSMFVTLQRGPMAHKALMYREGTTGKWLSSGGISFKGLPKTPESLVRVIGGADPVSEIYVLPAI